MGKIFNFEPKYDHFTPITMHERYVQRSTQRALKHPPVGLFFREHVVNIMELIPQLPAGDTITATYTAIEVGGYAKLAMIDNGPGIPHIQHDPEKVSLENFATFIGMTDDTKTLNDDHEHRGLRFLLGHTSKQGVLVYSKQAGQPVYMTAFGVNPATDDLGCITTDAHGVNAHEVKPDDLPVELQALGDHWTAIVVLGNAPESETAYVPFKGAEQIAGLHVGSQLTRRIAAMPDRIKVEMDWKKLFKEKPTTAFTVPFVPIMDFFDLHSLKHNPNVRPTMKHPIKKWSVQTPEGPIIHWIVADKRRTKARVAAINNIELNAFGALVFHKAKAAGIRISEFMDYHEATAKEAHSSWSTEAVFFEGLGEIADRLSLVIEIDDTTVPVEQIMGRTALGFNSDNHPYETFIGQDYRCTLRSFRWLEEKYRPKAVQNLISKSLEDEAPDDEKEIYEELEELFNEMKDLFQIKASRGSGNGDGGRPKGRFSRLLRRRGGGISPFPWKGRYKPDPNSMEWIDGPLPDFKFELKDWQTGDLLAQPLILREKLEERKVVLEMNINHYLAQRALDLVASAAGFIRWDLVPDRARSGLQQKLQNAGSKVFFRYWLFVTGDAAKGYMTSAEREAALAPPQLKLQLGIYHHWYEDAVSRVKVAPQTRKAREKLAAKNESVGA